MTAGSRRALSAALDAWVVFVTAVLLWPMVTRSGYPFARDLVLTPRLPLRAEALGLGAASARSAPLDAIVGVLSTIIDGGVLGRVLVPLALLLAGWGAHRLIDSLAWPARAAAAGFAVWNPYVVERLGLGQWAVLFGYAALFWLVRLLAIRPGEYRRVGSSAPWLGVAAITPSGAVLAGGAALAAGLARRHRRSNVGLLALVSLIQLPWLLPALLGGNTRVSDSAGVAAFAARAEGAGPPLWALIGLGGIWDVLSVPGSREGPLGQVTAMVVLTSIGGSAAVVQLRCRLPPRLLFLGLASLLLAALTSLPSGARVVGSLTGSVPGLGLLRDAQKWLAVFVVLSVAALGVCVDAGLRHLRELAPTFAVGAGMLGVAAPWLLLPDATVVVHRVVASQHYPLDFEEAAQAVAADPGPLVTLPWGLYRAYPWATAYGTYDPASRWFDAPVVTDDTLRVGHRTVRGESPYAARVGAVLSHPSSGISVGLARLGVRWVVVYSDVAGADGLVEAVEAGDGVTVVVGTGLTLLRLPTVELDADALTPVGVPAIALVVGTDLAVLLLIVVTSVLPTWRRMRSRSATLW